MAMDEEVVKAIKKVSAELEQSPDVADKLAGWLNELSDGKTALYNKDDVSRHIESVLSSVTYAYEEKTKTNQALKKMNLEG